MVKLDVVIAAVLCAGLCACVDFHEANSGEPAAKLEIISARNSAFKSNTYASFDDNPCANKSARLRNMTAGLSWASSGRAELSLPAGKPLFVQGNLNGFAGSTAGGDGQMNMYTNVCIAIATFTPKESHRYRITQLATANGCPLDVVDMATSVAPADFAVLNANACSRR